MARGGFVEAREKATGGEDSSSEAFALADSEAPTRSMTTDEARAAPNEERRTAQEDERASMSIVFPDEFAPRSPSDRESDRISYAIKLRPPEDRIADPTLWPDDPDLALRIAYPPGYPDEAPTLAVEGGSSLHPVQERALLRDATNAARIEAGTPCALSCIQAARHFFLDGGMAQAGMAMLSDDCLAEILSYVATTKEAVEGIARALPVFRGVERADVVWKEVCRRRWKEKWGFERRWERATEEYVRQHQSRGATRTAKSSKRQYWYDRYRREECDSQRSTITAEELCSASFDCRHWFSVREFRRQSMNMRDVLPTGLRESLAKDVRFDVRGGVRSEKTWFRSLRWSLVDGEVRLKRGSSSIESLRVRRLPTWGWQLWGNDFVFRSVDDDDRGGEKEESSEDLWEDYLSRIVMQEKPEWIATSRGPYDFSYPYSCRQIPDDEDLKAILDW